MSEIVTNSTRSNSIISDLMLCEDITLDNVPSITCEEDPEKDCNGSDNGESHAIRQADVVEVDIDSSETHLHESNDDHKESEMHSCQTCDFVANDATELNGHNQLLHKHANVDVKLNEQIVISCEKCDFTCRLNIQLKKHMDTQHINNWKYSCEHCDFGTDLIASLWEHFAVMHVETSRIFTEVNEGNVVLKMIADLKSLGLALLI